MHLSLKWVKEIVNRNNTLVSIILPTFNRGEKCVNVIRDVLVQTHQNIELLIVNDGSDNFNTEIIEKYVNSLNNNRIRYFKQVNKGTSSALNVGLENSKGEYVTWISDDNKIYNNFIEKLLLPRSDFSYCNYNLFYNDGRKTAAYNNHNDVRDLINNFRGMAGFMWKKELMNKIGKFNVSLSGLVDDYDYEIRTFLNTKNIVHIDEILIDFYQGEDTQSSKNYGKMKETHKLVQQFYNIYLDNFIGKEIIVYKSEKEDIKYFSNYHNYGKINICDIDTIYFNNDILFISKKYEILVDNILKISHINFSYFNDKMIYNNIVSKSISENKLKQREEIKISFIMAHRNRIDLLILTLSRLNQSKLNNFEVVIVDDRSSYDISFIQTINFKFPIKLIKVEDNLKQQMICPGNLYNTAFEKSIGEIIVIQNPECLHIGDIPSYIMNNFKYDDYLSFPCYSSNNIRVNNFILENLEQININNIEPLTKSFNYDDNVPNYPIWFQHSVNRNLNFHFCTVMSREYYQILGGFSNDYNDGFCYEDAEFIDDIRNKLKLNIKSIDCNENIGVVHMYHGRSPIVNITPFETTIEKRAIYEKYHLNENIYNYKLTLDKKICIPKIFHYYWDDLCKFSYMNLYSLKSSIYYHPDYIHIIWCPKNPEKNITWDECCNKDFNQDEYYLKYVNEIKNMKNVQIIYKNMDNFLKVDNNMSEIHKSDLFRYKILNHYGGIWSDLDIVYIKNVTDIINFEFDTINFLCKDEKDYYFPIGLLFSKRNSYLFSYIYTKAIENYDSKKYQCFGAELFFKIFDTNYGGTNIILKDKTISTNKDFILNDEFYMKYNWKKINELFLESPKTTDLSKTVGFHWFNGSDITKKHLKEIIKNDIPSKFNGILFKEKTKFHYQKIEKIIFFKFNQQQSFRFFSDKILTYKK